jgi:hypothetical protein
MVFGRDLNHDDRRFLTEVLIIVAVTVTAVLSGEYAILVVSGAIGAYTLFILGILEKGGLKAFDDFVDALFFRRTAIVLAAPAIALWHIL